MSIRRLATGVTALLLLWGSSVVASAGAEVQITIQPAQKSSGPVIPENAGTMDILNAILKNAHIIYEADEEDRPADILSESSCTRFTDRYGLSLGLGRPLDLYGERRDEWINNQCIVVRFRIHNDNGVCFRLDGGPESTVLFSLVQPDYPSFGLSTESLAGYRYFGLDYPTGFTFIPSQWFYALLAIMPDSRLCLAVWQEDDPTNLAYDQADLAEDSRFPTGAAYLNREWHLNVWVYDTDAVDMDIAGYYILEYSDFVL